MSNQKLEPGWLERDVNNAATRAKELLATPAPEARPAELALRLDAMAGVFQHWLDWQKDERDREGLTTTDHTHVISVPPQWPYRATLKTWIETLQIAARASSPDAHPGTIRSREERSLTDTESSAITTGDPKAERDAKDFAIEHGEYLAKSVENFLSFLNAQECLHDISDMDGMNDHWSGLKLDIHNFRKRAARASRGANPAQTDDATQSSREPSAAPREG